MTSGAVSPVALIWRTISASSSVAVEPWSSKANASTRPLGPLTVTGRIRNKTDVVLLPCPLNDASVSALQVFVDGSAFSCGRVNGVSFHNRLRRTVFWPCNPWQSDHAANNRSTRAPRMPKSTAHRAVQHRKRVHLSTTYPGLLQKLHFFCC